jgi:hypothetical protein
MNLHKAIKGKGNKAGGVAQVVECLSSMHEALSSDPNTAKKIYIKGSKFSVAAKLIPLEKF